MSRHTLERDPVLADNVQVRVRMVGAIAAPSGSRNGPRSLGRLPEPQPRTAQPSAARTAIDEVWTAHLAQPTRPTRDRLVEHYVPLVQAVAHRLAGGLPSYTDAADLVQAGVFGLIAAIERFDPARCPRFESYAAQRIRGAILDDLRAQDWVPRTTRARAREVDRARERLEGRLRRRPADHEIATELGVTVREVRAAQPVQLMSVEWLEEAGGGVSELFGDPGADPMVVVQARETLRQLRVAIDGLAERDRTVIHLYYRENCTLAEIGRRLGLTESRVCQLHGRAVARLRGRMEELAAA